MSGWNQNVHHYKKNVSIKVASLQKEILGIGLKRVLSHVEEGDGEKVKEKSGKWKIKSKEFKHLIVNQNKKKWRKIFLRIKKRVMDCDESFGGRAGGVWKLIAA